MKRFIIFMLLDDIIYDVAVKENQEYWAGLCAEVGTRCL